MSKSEELRKRLEAANRGPLPPREGADASSVQEELRRRMRKSRQPKRPEADKAPPTRSAHQPILFQRDPPRSTGPAPPPIDGPHVQLEEAVDGVEAPAPGGSAVYLVERRLAASDDHWGDLWEAFANALASRQSGLWRQLRYINAPHDLRPEDLVFLDLETTGLTSAPLFLIGTMVWEGPHLVTRQFFARDYSQERAAIELFLQLAAGRRLLISFNGKTFDLPYVRTRAAANGIACRFEMAHLDLLHVARRLWKHRLPDCRLQTLESCVCGRMRHDDIPGHLIPDAYHAYVRTGNAGRMVTVLEHNFLDLITMADIINRLPAPGQDERPVAR